MSAHLRFLGVAAYELVNSQGQHILVDPFLDGNPGSPVRSSDLERVDLILVSHGAYDHLGDTESIARRTGAPVVCGGEIRAYLQAKGIADNQIRATTWGICVEIAGIRVQPVECHHWSQLHMPDASFISGVPMGFVVSVDPGVRFYHYGDTAIFSDLRLIGELYRPTIGALGITNPLEIDAGDVAPGRVITAEMSPREGVLAARWLGLTIALPCHYINPDCEDVREFCALLERARAAGERAPQPVVLRPGEILPLEPAPDDQ